MRPTQTFMNFETASRKTLAFLHQRLGFDLWMVTRTEGDDWIILQTEDHGYNVKEGSVFRWADSFCSQMILGNGPNVAPDCNTIPSYASAAIGRDLKIGAYIGLPLSRQDGSVFGTLCAIHPAAVAESMKNELPLIQLLSELLSTVLNAELIGAEQARRADRLANEALTDSLTSLYNRRGWDQLVGAEENRCKRLGSPACVISIDLDGLKQTNDDHGHAAGDELIRRAGETIRSVIREQDVAARLGGDEFAILGVECDREKSKALTDRLIGAFERARVGASVGFAIRNPKTGLKKTLDEADQIMYASKRFKQLNRVK